MTKKKCQDDSDLFKEATRGVKPLKGDKVAASTKKKHLVKKIQPAIEDDTKDPTYYFSQEGDMEDVSVNQALSFTKSGLQQRKFRKLKQGKIPFEAKCDLHGLTSEAASQTVSNFIEQAILSHWHCVLIIHGKGGRNPDAPPVLKTKINSWLKQHPAVIAFCSALPKHGGVGAVYVLLKSGNW